MTEIHSLIRNHGWEAVKEMLPARKALVDIAAKILSQESDSFGITYSGFCLTAREFSVASARSVTTFQ